MTAAFTRVALATWPERENHYLRFGQPAAKRRLDRRRGFALFAPGAVFGYVRWRANDYGTESWTFQVLRAVAPGERAAAIIGVAPGAHPLLHVAGVAKVKRALAFVDEIERAGCDPANISEAYWRVAHNRLALHGELRPYGAAEHAAYLARQAFLS